MQSVILDDGSYWGIYALSNNGSFSPMGVLHGAATINGSSASGNYRDDKQLQMANGTYSGTASAQKNLNLTFNDPATMYISMNPGTGSTFNMSYDSSYNQPASLSAIAGTYLGNGFGGMGSSSVVISGSSVTVTGDCALTGTIAPHGTVNVFDVTLTSQGTPQYDVTGSSSCHGTVWPMGTVAAGTSFKGILFKTSGALSNYVELVAANDAGQGYFFMGSK